jgi:uracil phosphoribosyltransferase
VVLFKNKLVVMAEKEIQKIQTYLRFKKDKISDYEAFRERYEPLFMYLGKRTSNKLGLHILSVKAVLFEYDGDNVIKNLVTLRLTMECMEKPSLYDKQKYIADNFLK